MPGGGEVSLEVDGDGDRVEFLLAGVGDHPVTHDPALFTRTCKPPKVSTAV